MAKVIAVIPARMDSKRFPGKVAFLYKNKPLIYYVHNEISKSKKIDRLIVATNSKEVQSVVEGFGGEVIITSSRHQTGSDRIAEAIKKTGGDIIVNIQADNFGVKAGVLDKAITEFISKRNLQYGTLAYKIKDDQELMDPNLVKVVLSDEDYGLWFSRYPIPYLKSGNKKNQSAQHSFYGHIGIYFYRRQGLMKFAGWKRSSCEKAESLEQLRIIENGEKIKVFKTKMSSVSVDAPEDVKKLSHIYG
ncbi:MAG: 3-deoxy-manno-octulosonate cytidylyltransferase [bacterium]